MKIGAVVMLCAMVGSPNNIYVNDIFGWSGFHPFNTVPHKGVGNRGVGKKVTKNEKKRLPKVTENEKRLPKSDRERV